MVSIIGILLAVALLIYTCYKGIPAVIVAPLVSILVLITSGMDIATGMSGAYMEGMAGFIQKYFLTMFTGAIFGAMMGDSGAAKSIGLKFGRIARKFPGKEKLMALWSLAALSFILGYGGVSVFVAFFTVIAVAKEMFEELDVPWRLYGVNILGAGVLALTMAPGSPSVNNVIAGEALGTNAMAAPTLGIIGCLIAIFLAGIYFKWEISQVEKNHEGFLPTGAEIAKVQLKVADEDFQEMNIITCLIPSIVLIVTLNVFKQPVYIAATFGIIVGYAMYWRRLATKIETFKRGAMQSINSVVHGYCVRVRSRSYQRIRHYLRRSGQDSGTGRIPGCSGGQYCSRCGRFFGRRPHHCPQCAGRPFYRSGVRRRPCHESGGGT